MSHLPKVPVRFIEENKELLKSMASDQKTSTDYSHTVDAYPVSMEPRYRTAPDRPSGNPMFRRYPNGELDYEYAKHKIVDAIRKVKDGVKLTSLEKTALCCCFPNTFDYVDSTVVASVRQVNLKISSEESMILASKVANHLEAMMDYAHSCHAR